MNSPESDPKTRKVADKAVFAAGVVLSIGGAIAAATGGYRLQQEYSKDQRAIGAITKELDTSEFRMPSKDELEAARLYVQNLVGGIDENASDNELYATVGKIIVEKDDDLQKHYATFSRAENYRNLRDYMISSADADNLDDANIWTLASGVIAGSLGIATTASISATALTNRKKTTEASEQPRL